MMGGPPLSHLVLICFLFWFCSSLTKACNTVAKFQPTTLVLNHNTHNISCYLTKDDSSTSLLINDQIKQQNGDFNNISWTCINGGGEGSSKYGYNISILGTPENNNTVVRCRINELCSTITRIIVVDGPPSGPHPDTHPLNTSHIAISWSPAWAYPVNTYTVMLSRDGGVMDEVNTSNTSIVISRNDNIECALFNVSVTAITDIGAGEPSNTVQSGFPISFNSSTVLNTSVQRLLCNERREDRNHYRLTIDPPAVCQYQVLNYTVNMISSAGEIILSNEYSSLPYFYYTLPRSIVSDTYTITTTVRNQINEIINTTEPNKKIDYLNIPSIATNTTVTVPLTDRVVFVNESISFSCRFDENSDTSNMELLINGSNIVLSIHPPKGNFGNIHYERKSNGYTVTVNVSTLEYNNTYFRCVLHDNCLTEGYLYVTTDQPSPPKSVMVGSMSSNSLIITWSRPWFYPINIYTVLISWSEGVTNEVNTSDTSIVVSRNDSESIGECVLVNITVTAITDIGAGLPSITLQSGFPISLDSVAITLISHSWISDRVINITYKTYNICSFQDVSYEILVTHEDTNETKVINGSSITTSSVIGGLLQSLISVIIVDVGILFPGTTDLPGMYSFVVTAASGNETLTVPLLSNISPTVMVSPTTATSTVSSSFVASSSIIIVATNEPSFFEENVIYIASGAGGAVVLIVIICIVSICCYIGCKSRRKGPVLVIPPMEPNPTYAVTSDPDSTYETISNIRELTPIKNLTPSPSNMKRNPSPHQLPMTYGYHHHDGNGQMAAPNLPPPRAYREEVGGASVYPPLPPLQCPPREDEYIEMSSQSLTCPSPRYITGPSPRRGGGGLEPVDEIIPFHIAAGETIANGFHFEPNNTTV
ncbi:PREDICTED: uncharacterized protein LOC109583753 [Amphimedon queenslandica]|uniref:Fibronectin type-III domain-containing protein n=1 Tax=Amphimedon queenslandica TaxID=400682 RepID=A0AAN0JDC7_AMPQE|nr:PREDICTED: uncharacterized protein LOC109583753 [Amphimedon queenslandica]XP_019854756.1 PREDICTED: uncharacterized protein LOC109583753 [Amphimedon queenslandica]|eukprot:XP_019854755.1 PREDICTED: uncharacterized protein LOC109583753 [Amphimedon queenslandica]